MASTITTTTETTTPLTPTSLSAIHPRTKLYLAGINVTHSIAPPMHMHIGRTLFPHLSPSPSFINAECPTLATAISLFCAPDFLGGVVTMPYKTAIIPFLDEADPLVTLLGACNNVFLTPEGRLKGSNTDWRGVKGCLIQGEKALEARWKAATPSSEVKREEKVGLIIGAGGASRAAVYALSISLGCEEIYIINRDAAEVSALIDSTTAYETTTAIPVSMRKRPKLTHLTALPGLEMRTPRYIVGTVPDFEPVSREEKLCWEILSAVLSRGEERDKGVLLDMCFKPRNTRTLKMAREKGWEVVDGTGVIGWQIEEQWRLWVGAGEEGKGVGDVPVEEAWGILTREAERSTAINF